MKKFQWKILLFQEDHQTEDAKFKTTIDYFDFGSSFIRVNKHPLFGKKECTLKFLFSVRLWQTILKDEPISKKATVTNI